MSKELTEQQKVGIRFFNQLISKPDVLPHLPEDTGDTYIDNLNNIKWEHHLISLAHQAYRDNELSSEAFATCIDEILCW